MKYIVEINNTTGAFQIIICESQSFAMSLISKINSKTNQHGLTAYDRGFVNN